MTKKLTAMKMSKTPPEYLWKRTVPEGLVQELEEFEGGGGASPNDTMFPPCSSGLSPAWSSCIS